MNPEPILLQKVDRTERHDLVYTTLDSFTMNLFKVPVAESMLRRSHFEVSRYAIYSSLTVFDEAHLFASKGGDTIASNKRMHTAFATCLNVLSEASVPLLTMSATIPESLLNFLMSKVSGITRKHALVFDAKKSGARSKIEYVLDKDFIGERQNIIIYTRFIADSMFSAELLKQADRGSRILVIRNTVKKAHKTYLDAKELEGAGYSVMLLRSRFTANDRSSKLSLAEQKSKANDKVCLVSTQVVEAGVDIDFDVLFTDAAPMAQLVQRVGRVCRFVNGSKREGFVYLISGDGDGVYDPTLTMESIKCVRLHQPNDFQWKIPSGDDRANYMKILSYIYENIDFYSTRSFDEGFARALL